MAAEAVGGWRGARFHVGFGRGTDTRIGIWGDLPHHPHQALAFAAVKPHNVTVVQLDRAGPQLDIATYLAIPEERRVTPNTNVYDPKAYLFSRTSRAFVFGQDRHPKGTMLEMQGLMGSEDMAQACFPDGPAHLQARGRGFNHSDAEEVFRALGICNILPSCMRQRNAECPLDVSEARIGRRRMKAAQLGRTHDEIGRPLASGWYDTATVLALRDGSLPTRGYWEC
eukprot:gene4440-18056_t